MAGIDDVVWDAQGLVPVIVQDAGTGAVLALDVMDRQALETTLSTGWATYWVPADGTAGGCAASGLPQLITAVHLACDHRSLVCQVQPAGPLCRQGASGCFETELRAEVIQSADEMMAASAGRGDVLIRWLPEAAEGA